MDRMLKRDCATEDICVFIRNYEGQAKGSNKKKTDKKLARQPGGCLVTKTPEGFYFGRGED